MAVNSTSHVMGCCSVGFNLLSRHCKVDEQQFCMADAVY